MQCQSITSSVLMNILEQIKVMSRYNKNINNVIITILREVSSYSIKFLDTSI